MLAYLARRLALSGVLLLGVVLAVFLLHHALPMDPAAALLGKNYSAEKAHELREGLGLNDPLPVQFLRYLGALSRGDLGRSHVSNVLVTEELKKALPATIELGLTALLLAILLGVGLGILTSLRPRTWWDVGGLTVALVGVSLPIFWLGFLAVALFGDNGALETRGQALLASSGGGWFPYSAGALGGLLLVSPLMYVGKRFWAFLGRPAGRVLLGLGGCALGLGFVHFLFGFSGLPLGGRFNASVWELNTFVAETPGTTGFLLYDTLVVGRDADAFFHVCSHLLLPALVLSSVPTAIIARITRASMGEVLVQDYIRTAKAKGLTGRAVVLKHALRNAAIPIVTTIGTQLGYLIGGAVLTETIFQWPGMGRYVVDAILASDIKPLQASVLIVAVSFVVLNLVVDLSYAWLDPRVGDARE
ncbi:MAG: ABC transporter permease [Planctomycetes bacterium]|nr:ABC transporter permease [Planctomycetota bacterium]